MPASGGQLRTARAVVGPQGDRRSLATEHDDEHGVGDSPFLAAKVVTARFYCEQILPQAPELLPPVTAGASDLMALPPEQF